jgi:hypothetical protein
MKKRTTSLLGPFEASAGLLSLVLAFSRGFGRAKRSFGAVLEEDQREENHYLEGKDFS